MSDTVTPSEGREIRSTDYSEQNAGTWTIKNTIVTTLNTFCIRGANPTKIECDPAAVIFSKMSRFVQL